MAIAARAVVVVGGLGADSHSVGLFVLKSALASSGFVVVDLGIQNDFDRFLSASAGCDAVLISNMDGHAAHYLRDVGVLPPHCLWYLGGHPAISGDTAEFSRLGFARVYGGFVEPDEVVGVLRDDLSGLPVRHWGRPKALPRRRVDETVRGRDAVLRQWPSGAHAHDIGENAEVLAARASLAALQGGGHVLLQPRSGVPQAESQSDLFAALRASGADVLSLQVDSLTRDGRYDQVERVLAERGPLNGFPVVNHGVETLRRLTAESAAPVQTRHSARDPRLLAEISFAGGVTGFEGGGICYNIPYYPELPLTVSLDRWRYVDELTGRYAELGVVIDREFFGTLTATLIPPCLPITTNLLEAMLAVEAGVRSVSLAYAEQGCRSQDIAAIRVMGRLAGEILSPDGMVHVSTTFHQYMGAFPPHPQDAEELIRESARTAALAGAGRIVIKTPCEAARIPDACDNARALGIASAGVAAAGGAYAYDQAEENRIEASVRSLLTAVLALRPGDTAACIVEAFARGFLDVPFSPSAFNAGRMKACRDAIGAVRILDPGSMPLPRDVVAFESLRTNERLAMAGVPRAEAWRLMIDDVLHLARTRTGWPLDQNIRKRAAG